MIIVVDWGGRWELECLWLVGAYLHVKVLTVDFKKYMFETNQTQKCLTAQPIYLRGWDYGSTYGKRGLYEILKSRT